MNHVRDEHRILLSPSFSHPDSFAALWEYIAKKHHFLKLTFPCSPTRDELDEALSHQDGSLSPYSTRIFREYEVIYENKGTVLLTNKPVVPSLGTFFATEDTDAPHRYFVGFAFRVGPVTESITGLILYFDEHGICDSDRTILCQRVLATYDQRNGLLRSGQTFLYHQTLVFTQVHRDTNVLMLHLAHLPYETDVVQECVYYHTNLKPSREAVRLIHRFLCIASQDRATYLLDLGSLCITEESHTYREGIRQTQRFFLLESYTIYQAEQVGRFLEVAHLFPEREYTDGYPLGCIQCYEPVLSSTYSYKLHPNTTISCGMGSGYCPTCRIRYSKSKEMWVCAYIRLDGSLCHGELLEDNLKECTSGHLHASEQTILSLPDPSSYKYPYRRKLRLQWIPSEEALACARMTHILEEYPDSVYQMRGDAEQEQEQDEDLFKEAPETL